MDQTLILVDPDDHFLGYAPREACHRGDGLLHRAIAVLLLDRAGRLLLQNRRSPLWDGCWDVTGATHPLHLPSHDESYEEAAERCLEVEWGVKTPVRRLFSFVYFERFGDGCENERCLLLAGEHDGPVRMNPAHGYAYRWASLSDCQAEIAQSPERFTPWARIVVERLARGDAHL